MENLYNKLLNKQRPVCFMCGKEKRWLFVVFVFSAIAGACEKCCRKYPDAESLEVAINKDRQSKRG
jgi:hypothetical protein